MIEGDQIIDREVADGPRKTFDRVRSDTLKQLETAVSLTQGYQPIDPHFGDVGIMMALGENFARVTEIANRSNADGRLIDARNSIRPTRDAAEGAVDPCPICGINRNSPFPCECATPPKPAPDAVREALTGLADWCSTARAQIGAVDGYDYRSGEEFGLRCAEIEITKRAAALSAPVPSPDGAMDALGWLLDAIKSEVPAALATPLLRRRFKDAEKILLSPATGAAESISDEELRSALVNDMSCASYRGEDDDAPCEMGAVCSCLVTVRILRKMIERPAPPVRRDREVAHQTIYKHLYQALEKTGLSETFLTRDLWQATKLAADDLSLPVQPGAGERETTPDMRIAGGIAWAEALKTAETYVDCADACWKAMWDARPSPERDAADIEGFVSGPYKYEKDLHACFRVVHPDERRLVACVYATAGEEQAEADAKLFARALRQSPHSSSDGSK